MEKSILEYDKLAKRKKELLEYNDPIYHNPEYQEDFSKYEENAFRVVDHLIEKSMILVDRITHHRTFLEDLNVDDDYMQGLIVMATVLRVYYKDEKYDKIIKRFTSIQSCYKIKE